MAEQETIQRTFKIDTKGVYFVRTPAVMGGLTRRLTAAATKAKIKGDLTNVREVASKEVIGSHIEITVVADVVPGGKPS